MFAVRISVGLNECTVYIKVRKVNGILCSPLGPCLLADVEDSERKKSNPIENLARDPDQLAMAFQSPPPTRQLQ
jgi:hypothetical protein